MGKASIRRGRLMLHLPVCKALHGYVETGWLLCTSSSEDHRLVYNETVSPNTEAAKQSQVSIWP